MTYGWTAIDDIALDLDEAHPDVDPNTVRFDKLRKLVEELEHFEAEEGQHVNEQILEAIQAAWIDERADADDGDDDEPAFRPNEPYR